jgi:hypothetical protein
VNLPRALLVSAGNALEATGAPWVWWRRHYAELGLVMHVHGSKRFLVGAEIVAALESRMSPMGDTTEPVDELAEMRERIARAG